MRRIVVAEDEDDIREIASLSLELRGWQVTAVDGGEACIAAVLADPPDAVLLDVMMPGLDGPATLAALRAEAAAHDVPIVFLTAKTQAREREHLLALGAVGVLAKPFDPLRLAHDVAEVLGWLA
jgi:CheY-like chemotaxis protein